MSNKKFFTLVSCMAVFFAALFSSGCGGGHSGNFGNNPDDNVPEISKPVYVDYVISQLSIGYYPGDNADHVTQNVTLPVYADKIFGDIAITWQSNNPDIITSKGIVTRQSSNSNVILTVNVSDGTLSAERDFSLTVMRRRLKTPEEVKSEVKVIGVDEIKQMNQDNDDFRILYNNYYQSSSEQPNEDNDNDNKDNEGHEDTEDRNTDNYVTDIDGKYSEIIVDNADDAVDTVWNIHSILGIDDPYEELVNSVITSDEYGAEYTFAQVYNGKRVYGRNITVSTNESGETDFITSNFLPTYILKAANLDTAYTQEQAEESVKSLYSGSFDVHSKGTVIFSLEDYKSKPVTAYVINIYGAKDNEGYINEDIFINALTGEAIFGYSNIHTADIRSGINELDDPVSFPVIPDYDNNVEYMTTRITEANNTTIIVYNNTADMANLVRHPAGEAWTDSQQISAYTNMIEIIKWWKSEFNRDSIDGQGTAVKLIAHERVDNDRDNAYYWHTRDYREGIYICDQDKAQRSNASAIDVLTHESTHGVLGYRVDKYILSGDEYIDNLPYHNATGAIDEGYADIFGCIMTQQWLHGRDVHAEGSYTRNIENPADTNARQAERATSPTHYSERYIFAGTWLQRLFQGDGDHGYVHYNCSLISYPAYLMKTHVINNQEMSWKDLGRVWYKSMRMGYNATSDYFTVRSCLLRAAKKLKMSEDDIERIKYAFDTVGIETARYNITGKVSTYDKTALNNVNVNLQVNIAGVFGDIKGRDYNAVTDSEGNFSFEVPAGRYLINITHGDYVPFNGIIEIEEGDDKFLDIRLVGKSSSQPSNLSGIVRNALTGEAVEGAVFKIRHGWNIHTGDTAAELLSETGGNYTTRMIAGYYTVEVSKEGYTTYFLDDLVVPPSGNIIQDIILSPNAFTDNKYRITLQWDESPRDLDAHLIGILPDGKTFHVYYSNREAYDSSGSVTAVLDHDDTNGRGFETITFDAVPGARYKYFVHWYSSDYSTTWTDSNAVVNLYKSGQQNFTFTVPDVDAGKSSYSYWNVLDLRTGMKPVTPDDSNSLVNSEPALR
ncbi:MAG: M4 family metallopeptidase [Synergistaceae bacterium]|nr:M4 family metallopeptidase [Synergistaceae bacterium]